MDDAERNKAVDSFVNKGLLYDYYGELLTEHRRRIYEDAVYHDLSLTEIAEREGTSRQSVHDLISRTTRTLADYEEKLGMIARVRAAEALCEELKAHAEKTGDPEVKEIARRIGESLRA